MGSVGRRTAGTLLLLAVLAVPAGARAASDPLAPELLNGSFEVNGGLGTDLLTDWIVAVHPDSSGSWYAQSAQANPLFPGGTGRSDLPAPTEGLFAAMTDQDGPGSRVLYQDVLVPLEGGTFACDLFLASSTTDFVIPDPATLSFVGAPSQHLRIDVMHPGASAFSVAAGDVLLNVYVSSPGTPGTLTTPMNGYVTVAASLNEFAGQVVRIRIAQVDNQFFFNAGVDNCTLTPTPCEGGCDVPEVRCDDCLDNDLDGLVDRDDPDCPRRADGGGAGLGDDEDLGKAIVKCQAAIARASAKFVEAAQKRLETCVAPLATCLHLRPDDPTCVTAAQARCAIESDNIEARDAVRLRGLIARTCGSKRPGDPPRVPLDDLLAETGLGFEVEAEACALLGVPSLAALDDVAECVLRRQRCRVEELLSHDVPRAAELLALAGVAPVDFPCIADGVSGGNQGLGEPGRGEAAVKCLRGIRRVGRKFVSMSAKHWQKCLHKVLACVQLKPADQGCLAGARAACAIAAAKIDDPTKGERAKAGKRIEKACGSKRPGDPPQVALGDLLGATGLGFGAYALECATFDVASLASAGDVSACLLAHHACRIDQLLEAQMPRALELRALGTVP